MSSSSLFSLSRYRSWVSTSVSSWALILFGSILGILTASLLVAGRWQLAFGLVLILPAAILLFKYPFLAVIIWLLLDPFLMTVSTTSGRLVYWMVHRALPPLTIGVLGISYLIRIRKLPKLGLAEFAMVGYIGVSVFSIAMLNINPQETFYQFYDRVISPMCLYFIVRLASPGEKQIKQLIPAIFFIGVTQAVIGTLSWLAPQFLPRAWLGLAGERTTGSLASYSVYTSTMIFAGLFLLHASLIGKPGPLRALLQCFFFVSIFCVFISFSRGSWLAGIIVLAGLVFVYPKFTISVMLIVVPATIFVAGILLADYFYDPSKRLNESQEALSRLPVALASYRMFQEKPVFGWGYGNFDYYDRQYQGPVGEIIGTTKKDLGSHNLYLTILAEQGIVGLTLFLIPIFWLLFETLRKQRNVKTDGLLSRKLLFLLWLVILDHFIVNNFSHMRIGFGLGMWWLTLGLISNLICTTSPTLQKTQSALNA